MDDDRRSQTDTDAQDRKPSHSSGRRRRRDKKTSSATPVNETLGKETSALPPARSGRAEQDERAHRSQAQGGKPQPLAEQGKSASGSRPASSSQQGRGDDRGQSKNRSRRKSANRPAAKAATADQTRSSATPRSDAIKTPVPRGYLAAAFDDADDLFDDELVEPAETSPPTRIAKPKTDSELQRSRRGDETAARNRQQGQRPKRRPRDDAGGAKPSLPKTIGVGPTEKPTCSGDAAPEPAAAPRPERPPITGQEARGPTGKKERRAAGKRPARRPASVPPQAESDVPARDEESAAPAKVSRPTRARPAGAFAAMGLSDDLLDALFKADYLEPTPVQAGLIPRALAGTDVMGQARTGTGKTAAFAIPILQRVAPGKAGAAPRALALVPTRELAVQVRDECQKLALFTEHRVAAVYGGKPIRQQADQLRRGVDVLIGTPGRVIDMINRGLLSLGDLQVVVLDEADRMLDIGFRPDIERILRRCPTERQTLLLSATIPPPVKRLAERYMRSPEVLDFSAGEVAVETIEQFYFTVDPERKFDLLIKLLEREQPRQAIVFVRTRRGADRLFRKLTPLFEAVDAIHGDLAQSARDRVMRRFRDGKSKILVATDVVGRGIDVSGISHIINFDVPQFCDDYVHRVGRTGRMGREGVAFTFVTPEEGNELTRIEMRINRLLKRDEIPGFVALEKPKPTEQLEDPTDSPEPSKTVFGRPSKRYRRAL